MELLRPKSHIIANLTVSTTQTAFTSVDTGSTSLTSPSIVRVDHGSVVRGINPWGCKAEVKLVRREPTLNTACLNSYSFFFSQVLHLSFSPSQPHSLAALPCSVWKGTVTVLMGTF